MNCLAKHFAEMFEHSVQENKNFDFRSTFKYNNIHLCQLQSQEYATIERYIDMTFEKNINNEMYEKSQKRSWLVISKAATTN